MSSVAFICRTHRSSRWARRACKGGTSSTALAKRGTPADVQAAMPVRPFPRPARRARAVSAAIGRCDHTPSTEVHSRPPLQLLQLLGMSRWRVIEVAPQYVYQPHQPGSHRRSSLPPDFLHRCARHARRTCSRLRCGAGYRGDFGCTDRVDLSSSLRRRSGCCLRPCWNGISACSPSLVLV